MDFTRLRSIRQLAEAPGSPFSEPSLRWMVFRADQIGLSPAIVRVGSRLYLDLDAFATWLEEHRGK